MKLRDDARRRDADCVPRENARNSSRLAAAGQSRAARSGRRVSGRGQLNPPSGRASNRRSARMQAQLQLEPIDWKIASRPRGPARFRLPAGGAGLLAAADRRRRRMLSVRDFGGLIRMSSPELAVRAVAVPRHGPGLIS
jgi:hypothetical protein